MKRIEMEIFLEQTLIELRGYQKDNAEIVDVLLYAIEEAGMTPPVYHKEIESGRVFYDWNDVKAGVKFQSFFEWEDSEEE